MTIPIEALPLPAARTGASDRRPDGGEFPAALEAILAGGAASAEAGDAEAEGDHDGDGAGPAVPGRAAVARVFEASWSPPASPPARGLLEEVPGRVVRAGFEAALAAGLFGPDAEDRAMQLLADVDPDDLEAALSLPDDLEAAIAAEEPDSDAESLDESAGLAHVPDEHDALADLGAGNEEAEDVGSTVSPEPLPEPEVDTPEGPGDDLPPAAAVPEDEPAVDHEDAEGSPRAPEPGRGLGAERRADPDSGRPSPIAEQRRADAATRSGERPELAPDDPGPDVGASRRALPAEGRPSPIAEEQRSDVAARALSDASGHQAARVSEANGRAAGTAPVGETRTEPEPARGSSPAPPPGEPAATDARPAPPAPPRPVGLPAAVQRVLDAVAELEHAPPPRQLTLEVGESRVRIGLEEGSVRLTLLDGDGDTEELLREAAEALAERGFDLAGDQGSGAEGEASGERPGPDEPTAPRRPRARAGTGLRL